DEVDPPVAAGEAGDDVTRPVGGVVVDDDHMGVGVKGEQGREQGAEVLPLVVRGDRDEKPAGLGHVQQWLRGKGLTLLKKPQDAEKGPDARRRPTAAREASSRKGSAGPCLGPA